MKPNRLLGRVDHVVMYGTFRLLVMDNIIRLYILTGVFFEFQPLKLIY